MSNYAQRTRITWLHLSDMHVTRDREVDGKPIRRLGLEIYDQSRHAFLNDLERQMDELGLVPDLVLVTGDLALSGEPKQYDEFDEDLLEPVLERVRARGGDPAVFAVPGNHDLQRPQGAKRFGYSVLRSYDARDDENDDVKELRTLLWHQPAKDHLIHTLFASYQAWATRTMHPTLGAGLRKTGLEIDGLVTSHFPGDLSVVVRRGDLQLLLGGLNSAWIQYSGEDFTGKLHVTVEQLRAALSQDASDSWIRRLTGTHALLLLHHPPLRTDDYGEMWLSPVAKRVFDNHIYPTNSGYFDACLFGHMHEPLAQSRGGSSGVQRSFYQAPSLFGLEGYGKSTQRLHAGYTLGALGNDGEIRLWPRAWTQKDSGDATFSAEGGHGLGRDGSFTLKPADARRATQATAQVTLDMQADRAALQKWLGERHETIELISPLGPLKCPFDQIYIPLALAVVETLPQGGQPEGAPLRPIREHAGDEVALSEIFRRADQQEVLDRDLIVRGEPGAGKTTTLEKIAHSMLGESGGAAVGLAHDTWPMFLPLRHLVVEDFDDPDPLLRLARREAKRDEPALPDDLLERVWRRGRLLLLLDGLDEVADHGLRCRVVEHIVDRARERRRFGVRCVVSSRHSGITDDIERRLGVHFMRIDVCPLRPTHIENLVVQWFHKLTRVSLSPHPEDRTACRRADERAHKQAMEFMEGLPVLESTVRDDELKVLLGTPLILTLLCSVAWKHKGRIPEDRRGIHGACLDVLLERRSKDPGGEPPIARADILPLLRLVANGLHEDGLRDRLDAARFDAALRQLQPTTRSGRPAKDVLSWMHEQAGILTRVHEGSYAFVHLTFQEYLTAAHVADEGGGVLERLADRFGEPWWQEVIAMCLAATHKPNFVVFMDRLVTGDRWLSRAAMRSRDPDPRIASRITDPWGLLERCWKIAVVARTAKAAPFLPILREPRSAEVASMREPLLNMLAGQDDPDLLAWVANAANDAKNAESLREAALAVATKGIEVARSRGVTIAPELEARVERARGPMIRAGGIRRAGQAPSTWIEETTGIEMLEVPGDTFMMGSTDDPEAHKDEKPAHPVTLSTYYLSRTPVTNAQYDEFTKACASTNPHVRESRYRRDRRFHSNDQPVVGVSWYDAQRFCEWLSATSGRGFRLPSEAQWEYAARGTGGRKYPWGKEEPDQSRACFGQSLGTGRPSPVGRFPLGQGPFGHLDLAGNVWEWCQDFWDEQAYQRQDVWSKVDPVMGEGTVDESAVRVQALIDELSNILPDPDHARLIASRAGFPAAHLPQFRTPLVFWTQVVEESTHGRIPVAALIDEVAKQFPHNARLIEHKQRIEEQNAVHRVCRGGAWVVPALSLRAAYRVRSEAGDWDVVLGFRVACAPASP